MIASLLFTLVLLAPPHDLAAAREARDQGRLEEARALLEEVLAEGGADERAARLLLAEIELAEGAPDAVVPLLDPYAGARSEDHEALLLLGRAFRALAMDLRAEGGGEMDVAYYLGEAQAYLDRAAEHAPAAHDDGQAALEAGYLALYESGDVEGTLARAERLLAAGTHDAEARLLRGCARVYVYVDTKASGSESQAETVWNDAVADLTFAARVRADGDAWWQLLWLYEEHGRAQDAVEAALRHAEHAADMDLRQVYRLARRYAAEGAYDAAAQALAALVERDAQQLTAWIGAEDDPTQTAVTLGWAVTPLLEEGRIDEARDLLEPLIAAEPQDADIWNNYGLLCRDAGERAERLGEDERAREYFETSYRAYEQALSLDPANPSLLNDTALVLQYHLHRDLERARELYGKAIALAEARIPGEPDADVLSELRVALRDARNNLARLGGS